MEELIQFESEIKEDNLLKMDAPKEHSSYIKVLGVGGAGTNAVNHMYRCGIEGVDFIVCNTDYVSLETSPVSNKIQLGKGLGAGNKPEKARLAAEEAEAEIKSYLEHNTRMLFVTAGMGGGTGTGAAPVIARFAKEIQLESADEEQILVVGVVTLPFSFEGRRRRTQAQEGINNLKAEVDAIITINTDKLREYGNFTMTNAFTIADDILLTAAKGISEMMTSKGRVHVDFQDVRSVMRNSGVALMGTGIAEGENRAMEAIQAATTSKLLNDNDITATKNILLYFLSSENNEIRMEEIDTITTYLEEITNDEVDYIWGMGIDNSLGDKLSITLVATGFESKVYEPQVRIRVPESFPLQPETPEKPQIPQTSQTDGIHIKPQEPIVDEVKEGPKAEEPQKTPTGDRVVIVVNEDMQPINPSSETSSVESTAKFTGIIQPPQITVITRTEETPKSTETLSQPKEIIPNTTATIAQTTETVSLPPTNDINTVFKGLGKTQNSTFEERMERIQAIKKMLSTEEGINRIIETSPLEIESMNFSQAYSQSTPQSNYSVNKDGQVVYGLNKSINACVD